MLSFPGTVFLQLPSINDVAIENEFVAGMLLQEVSNLLSFGARRTQMHIRNHDSFEMSLQMPDF